MERRSLLKGAAASLVLAGIPVQLPARSAQRSVAWHRYKRLRKLLRTDTSTAHMVRKLIEPASKPGGYLRISVERRTSWLATADAQIALEPILVTAPVPIEPGLISEGSIGSPYGQQYFQILMLLVAQQRAYEAQQAALAAQQAALVNVMVVPPPEPTIIPPVVEPEPEPAPEPTFSDPLFDNPHAQYVASALEDVGLTLAEAFAVAFFVGETAGILSEALPALAGVNVIEFIATELAVGNIVARVALTAAGLTVQFVVVGGVLLGTLAVIGITLYYVLPEIDRMARSNVSEFTSSTFVETPPQAVEPVAAEEPSTLMPFIPDGAPTSQQQSEQDFPGYNWYWDIEQQTWIYFGE